MVEIETTLVAPEKRSAFSKNIELVAGLVGAAATDYLLGPRFTDEHGRFSVGELTANDMPQANQLVYNEYVRVGQLDSSKPSEESLPIGGTVFGVKDRKSGEVIATARFIYPKKENELPDGESSGLHSLEYPFDQLPDDRAKLSMIDPDTLAEFRCLAKKPGASQLPMAQLIRSMYQYSRQNGIRYWLSAFDPGPFTSVTRRFAALGTMTRLSEGTIRYPGNLTPKIPVLVDIDPDKNQPTYMSTAGLNRRERLISRVATSYVKRGSIIH